MDLNASNKPVMGAYSCTLPSMLLTTLLLQLILSNYWYTPHSDAFVTEQELQLGKAPLCRCTCCPVPRPP